MTKVNKMSLLRPKTQNLKPTNNTNNTEGKKKGNILQFFKKIDDKESTNDTEETDEFEKNNKEFLKLSKNKEILKSIKLKNVKESTNDNISNNNSNIDSENELESNSENKLDNKINIKIESEKIKMCKKCNTEKAIDNFSKHKTTADGYDNRCKDCIGIMRKKIKEKIKNENTEFNTNPRKYIQTLEEYLDTLEPDLTTSDWQGGKLKGTYFKRKNANKYTVCVEKKSIVVSTEEDAKKTIISLNNEYNCAKNMYKIITYKNKNYVIMQLSNGYVGLFDFDKLDLLRKINLAVTRSSKNSNSNAKYYCLATVNNRGTQIHNVITDYDMVDHRDRYPLDNRCDNLSLTNYRENNMNRSKISNKKIDYIDDKYKCSIKYIAIDPKTKAFCSRTDENSFSTKQEGLDWLNNKSKDLDHDISIYDDEVMELKKSYEEIMTKYADDFKWCDNDETKDINKLKELNKKSESNSESESELDKEDSDTEQEPDKKLSKLDKYKQFKDIDNDFTIQKYNVNLKSNTISHLTFQDIEYKFCSQCNNWNKLDSYHAYKLSVDGLYKYCKTCSKNLKQKNENTNATTKSWKEKNKEKVAEYNKKYREKNREKLLESSRKSQEEKDNLIKDRKNKYYEEFKTKCEEHEGQLLSPEDEYETAHSKLQVRCKNNHEFEITWNNCKNNKWCA